MLEALSKTDDIAELKEMLQVTFYNSGYARQSSKRVFKLLNAVAKGGTFTLHSNCNVVLLYYFILN